MNRLLAVLIACAALGLGLGLGSGLGSSVAFGGARTTEETFVARPGDRIRVLDAPIACRVAHIRQLGGRVALDCRRGGPLPATYGTLLTAREAAVVDFESAHSAKLVAVARHGVGVRRCGKSS
jgi:hypothetical protein